MRIVSHVAAKIQPKFIEIFCLIGQSSIMFILLKWINKNSKYILRSSYKYSEQYSIVQYSV